MKKVLGFVTENAYVIRQKMTNQADQKRSKVAYQEGNMVFLSSKNISNEQPIKKLDDKLLGPFRVSKKVRLSYRLDLPCSMKIYDVFYPSLFWKTAMDPLTSQRSDLPMSVIVDKKEEWEIDNILDARYFDKSQQL